MNRYLTPLSVLVLASAIVLAGCGQGERPNEQPQPKAADKAAVPVAPDLVKADKDGWAVADGLHYAVLKIDDCYDDPQLGGPNLSVTILVENRGKETVWLAKDKQAIHRYTYRCVDDEGIDRHAYPGQLDLIAMHPAEKHFDKGLQAGKLDKLVLLIEKMPESVKSLDLQISSLVATSKKVVAFHVPVQCKVVKKTLGQDARESGVLLRKRTEFSGAGPIPAERIIESFVFYMRPDYLAWIERLCPQIPVP